MSATKKSQELQIITGQPGIAGTYRPIHGVSGCCNGNDGRQIWLLNVPEGKEDTGGRIRYINTTCSGCCNRNCPRCCHCFSSGRKCSMFDFDHERCPCNCFCACCCTLRTATGWSCCAKGWQVINHGMVFAVNKIDIERPPENGWSDRRCRMFEGKLLKYEPLVDANATTEPSSGGAAQATGSTETPTPTEAVEPGEALESREAPELTETTDSTQGS
eukprot:m.437008 g.437008  ORF g.437008 m.437008 type:complete len:217 (-) comp21428_c0_seq8:547-1197(-)